MSTNIIIDTYKRRHKPMKNNYLYKTDVEDWGNNHRKIWRLKLKLTPQEWGEIKQYFKYYKNRNLVGWGTTSPIKVTEILTLIRGDDTIKAELTRINEEIAKNEKIEAWGYNDVIEEMDYYGAVNTLRDLRTEKDELLGFKTIHF